MKEHEIEARKVEKAIADEFNVVSYIFVLKLLNGIEQLKYLNLNIPDLLVFNEGKATRHFYISREHELKISEPRDGLSLMEVRKIMISREQFNMPIVHTTDILSQQNTSPSTQTGFGRPFIMIKFLARMF